MKKLFILGGLALTFFCCIQAYWIYRSFDAESTQFDHSVSVALYAVADTMAEHATVEKRSPNYFYVTTNCPMSDELVDTLIQKEFAQRNLQVDYELGVYNAEDDSLVHGKYIKEPKVDIAQPTTLQADLTPKNFAVLFPTKEKYLMSKTEMWMISILALIFLMGSYIYTFRKSPEFQTTTNHIIRVGNSELDFQNYHLTIGRETFQLTYKENEILKLLFNSPNQVIERDIFLKNIWEKDGFFVARSMDVFISKVRKYLKNDPSLKIENLRSIGYRLSVITRKPKI